MSIWIAIQLTIRGMWAVVDSQGNLLHWYESLETSTASPHSWKNTFKIHVLGRGKSVSVGSTNKFCIWQELVDAVFIARPEGVKCIGSKATPTATSQLNCAFSNM